MILIGFYQSNWRWIHNKHDP